ncbi:hypothetical protein L6452_33144 [Arctium lappa]|uniref:Uncharacterized protein n=1 Tax=Arctium lappa TaxID=4217 RepID=A0ACB8ZB82_ARCLA|nr:hypothetical protein L6452_33144 [Arctium lappa]
MPGCPHGSTRAEHWSGTRPEPGEDAGVIQPAWQTAQNTGSKTPLRQMLKTMTLKPQLISKNAHASFCANLERADPFLHEVCLLCSLSSDTKNFF